MLTLIAVALTLLAGALTNPPVESLPGVTLRAETLTTAPGQTVRVVFPRPAGQTCRLPGALLVRGLSCDPVEVPADGEERATYTHVAARTILNGLRAQAACPRCLDPRGPRVTVEILELNQAWTRAWLDRNAQVVDGLMAPGYVYIAPNGQALDRQKILSIIRSSHYRLLLGARTEVAVTRLNADCAAVCSRWTGEGSYAGQDFRDDHRCTTILVRQEGSWKIILEHCSTISEPNKP